MAIKLRLKLLVDKESQRVLFAEAGKDVVDFLFGLLNLPLGFVTRLLTTNRMVGCVAKIFESVQNLDEDYMVRPEHFRNALINPNLCPTPVPLLLEASPSSSSAMDVKKFYRCSSGSQHGVSDVIGTKCPSCYGSFTAETAYVAGAQMDRGGGAEGSGSGTGYVKGVLTYMVMDDLSVRPMSTISAITLLNEFQIKDVGSLTERNVELGVEEGVELLSASLRSTTVLTDVFLSGLGELRAPARRLRGRLAASRRGGKQGRGASSSGESGDACQCC